MSTEVSSSRRRVRAGGTRRHAGARGAGGLLERSTAAPAAAEVPTGTATVTRADIVERQQVAGTLGYDGSFTVVAQVPGEPAAGSPAVAGGGQSQGGTITRLPAPGAVLARDGRGHPCRTTAATHGLLGGSSTRGERAAAPGERTRRARRAAR